MALWPSVGHAHDASSWGGLFRTLDGGLTWFQASSGKVMGGALAVAVDPGNPARLLLGTDSGLLGSHNAGRDWDLLAPDVLEGPVFAVAFQHGGREMFAASGSRLARSEDGALWRTLSLPAGSSPVRGIVTGGADHAVFLLGWQGLYRTADDGTTWSECDVGLPAPTVTSVLVAPDSPEQLFAISSGEVWHSLDSGQTWRPRQEGLPVGEVQTLTLDTDWPHARRLWAGAANQVFRADDAGSSWHPVGQPLPEKGTEIRGIAVDRADGSRIVLSTHRGLYASRDGGATWISLSDNLPAHIEAGPLVVDQTKQSTLYAGFSVTPYGEVWRNAAASSSVLARIALSEMVGASAFILFVALMAGLALHRLAR